MFRGIFSPASRSPKQAAANKDTIQASPSSSKTRTKMPSAPTASSSPYRPSRGSSSAMAAWAVPPFPHPLPERRIGILPTDQGLLVYPRSSLHTHHDTHHDTSRLTQHTKAGTSAGSTGTHAMGSGDGFKVATIGTSNASSLKAPAAPFSAAGGPPSITSLDIGFLIDWSKEAKITPLPPSDWKSIVDSASAESPSLECSGIVGLSRFFSSSYLFVITSSKLTGHYFHESRPIYCCTGVLAIPLLKSEASQAIRSQVARGGEAAPLVPDLGSTTSNASKDDDESGSDAESDSSESDYDDVQTPAAIPREPFFASTSQQSDSLRTPKSRPWLTRAARSVSAGRIEAVSGDPSTHLADAAQGPNDAKTSGPEEPTIAHPVTADEQWHAAKQAELEDKAVRETTKYWARGEFWFSYDFDLTTSLQNKRRALEGNPKLNSKTNSQMASLQSHSARAKPDSSLSGQTAPAFPILAEPFPGLPLWRRADRRFWHNEHMSKDLINAGLHAYILPVMQGYLQTVELPVQRISEGDKAMDAADQTADAVLRCQLMVISRRSKERAGLRYQRRGINESGQVANFVETEQILYVLRGPVSFTPSDLIGDVMSFVQIRGSIPLYWSQSPFSLKPPPVLERTEAENAQACRNHFSVQLDRYGSITCINLAEQGGKEGQISKAYRTAVENFRSDPSQSQDVKTRLRYVDFDFHKECSGMKFENVAKLIGQMEGTLGEMKHYHHRTAGDASKGKVEVLSRQGGVFRVSCLDCLDRTNVVQSAFARHVLTGQLAMLQIQIGAPAA